MRVIAQAAASETKEMQPQAVDSTAGNPRVCRSGENIDAVTGRTIAESRPAASIWLSSRMTGTIDSSPLRLGDETAKLRPVCSTNGVEREAALTRMSEV